MEIKQLLTGKYLHRDDIEGGSGINFKIQNVTMEEVNEGEHKPLLHSPQLPKPMVLNLVNLKFIAGELGSTNTDNWIGSAFNVWNDPSVIAFGKMTGGLRVRSALNAQQMEAMQGMGASQQVGPQGQPDDDIPF